MKIIFPTGAIATLDDTNHTLLTLQHIVGGYIQIIKHKDSNRCLIVNKDGIAHNLPYNNTATNLAHPNLYIQGFLRGTVIECTKKEMAKL